MSTNPSALARPQWAAATHRLEHLQDDLALLPVGWGADRKAPMLEGWQRHVGFSVQQLQGHRGIRSIGARTGVNTGPLLCFDFDGSTALDLACQLGFAPWDVTTWQVHRNNDPFRLKVLFRPTCEQIAQLPLGPGGGVEFQGKTITAAKTDTSKGEALEVFFHGGRQVIVLGEHPSSGGAYFWPEGLGPEALSAPSPAWWTHALLIAKNCQDRGAMRQRSTGKRHRGRRLDPCPICGRHSGPGGSGLWCEQTIDGLILCMPGSTFSAEQRRGRLRLGQVVDGWALVKRSPIPEGDVLVFKPHQSAPGCGGPRPLTTATTTSAREVAHGCPF
jgi:hypothetical protein